MELSLGVEGTFRDQGDLELTGAEGTDGVGIWPLKGCTPAWRGGGRRKNEMVLRRQRKKQGFFRVVHNLSTVIKMH